MHVVSILTHHILANQEQLAQKTHQRAWLQLHPPHQQRQHNLLILLLPSSWQVSNSHIQPRKQHALIRPVCRPYAWGLSARPSRPCLCPAVWLLHEQVSIALLECGNQAAALPLVKAVLIKFPQESIRARRMQVSSVHLTSWLPSTPAVYNCCCSACAVLWHILALKLSTEPCAGDCWCSIAAGKARVLIGRMRPGAPMLGQQEKPVA